MKADEDTKDTLIYEFEQWSNSIKHIIDKIISAMRKAETVEELMALKRELLLRLLDMLPLHANYCYFCVKNFTRCEKCEYAKFHGICTKEPSDYATIKRKLDELKTLIKYRYYAEEKYD